MARPPRVRNAVHGLLIDSARHDWSIEDIAAALAADGIKADFSSVYRGVEALVEDGSVRRVELGTAGSRYEAGGEPHGHVRCKECGAIEAVPNSTVAHAASEVERATRFVVAGHETLFSGVCPGCAKAGSARPPG